MLSLLSCQVLPYWGNPHDRKVIRKFWSQVKFFYFFIFVNCPPGFFSPSICLTCLSPFEQKTLYTQNAPFHVVITSYQLVVQDVKYFQRVKWQYMVLDEAQALKSSSR